MINLEIKLIIKRSNTCVNLCVKYLKVSFLYKNKRICFICEK